MDIGIGVSEDVTPDVQRHIAREVEGMGLHSLWTNEARGRDALLVCSTWADATTRLRVGVGVVPVWSRTPAQLAMAAATLQESTEGRFLLGIGVSHPATMDPWHGAGYRRPLEAAGDTLAILRRLFAGEPADHEGEVFSSRGLRLAMDPLPPSPPVYLAAMGPRMLELAAQHADGVLLN
ncbi:MAG: LLM class flavin-dependent oxidoreductase, partial [Nitriliruptorales bacterium]